MKKATMKMKGVNFYRASLRFMDWARKEDPSLYREKLVEDMMDALRYDRAFVRLSDPTIVAFPAFVANKGGRYPVGPTVDLWRSWGIQLEPLDLDYERIYAFCNESREWSEWVTYRHPLTASRQVDYFKVVPVSLAQILQASSFSELSECA